jgi:hypothetical protein
MSLQQLQERLLAWATAEPRKEELLTARRAHFERCGEPHEEDRTYEPRMTGMLDFYLYDYRPEGDGRSTVERFLEAEAGALPEAEVAAYRDLAGTIHGLFEVRKIRDGKIVLRDAFTAADHEVTERRQVAGLDKGDVLEARLLPHEGNLYFSGAFLYHPREARKQILAEVKRLKKAAGKGGAPDVAELLATLSRMALKLERYRNVRLESIYDFEAEARAVTAARAARTAEPKVG